MWCVERRDESAICDQTGGKLCGREKSKRSRLRHSAVRYGAPRALRPTLRPTATRAHIYDKNTLKWHRCLRPTYFTGCCAVHHFGMMRCAPPTTHTRQSTLLLNGATARSWRPAGCPTSEQSRRGNVGIVGAYCIVGIVRHRRRVLRERLVDAQLEVVLVRVRVGLETNPNPHPRPRPHPHPHPHPHLKGALLRHLVTLTLTLTLTLKARCCAIL